MRVLPCAAALRGWRRKSCSLRRATRRLRLVLLHEGVDLLAELSDLRLDVVRLAGFTICGWHLAAFRLVLRLHIVRFYRCCLSMVRSSLKGRVFNTSSGSSHPRRA